MILGHSRDVTRIKWHMGIAILGTTYEFQDDTKMSCWGSCWDQCDQLPTSGSFFSLSFFEVWGDSNLGLLDSPILEKIRRTSIHQSLNGTLPTDP